MQSITPRHRARAVASLITVAGLGLAATAVGGSAQAAAPAAPRAGDCALPFPVADLVDGQPVTGLTVTKGTTPEGFTGEVLGVLDDGIAPGLDMVMMRLTSPEVDRVGIWQGMSGSPVYAADGRLIGAVAYGLASGPSAVAGVTPFEDMDDYLTETAARTVKVDASTARAVARRTDVRPAQAARGFRQLPVPLGVAGVGAQQLALAASKAGAHSYLPRTAYAVGRAAPGGAGADTIVAGGNLAASLSYGDVTMAAVGTTTSVCGSEVVGFGHPLDHLGATTLALHPASAIYIQEDSFAGFKVANVGAPAGTITDDRTTGISGLLGTLPDTSTIESTVTWGERSRSGVSHVSVQTPDALASTTFYGFLANQDRVVDGAVDASEVASWTVRGTGPDGAPFELTSSDRYTSAWDLTSEVGFALGDTVYAIAGIPQVSIQSVTTSASVEPTVGRYRVVGLEQRASGEWTTVQRRLRAAAGARLKLRVVLRGADATTTLPLTVKVPRRLAGAPVVLELTGGMNTGGLGRMRTLEQAREAVRSLVRNDAVQVTLAELGNRGRPKPVSTQQLGPVDGVVGGFRSIEVRVR